MIQRVDRRESIIRQPGAELVETYQVARTTAGRAEGVLREEDSSTRFRNEVRTLRSSQATASSKPPSVNLRYSALMGG